MIVQCKHFPQLDANRSNLGSAGRQLFSVQVIKTRSMTISSMETPFSKSRSMLLPLLRFPHLQHLSQVFTSFLHSLDALLAWALDYPDIVKYSAYALLLAALSHPCTLLIPASPTDLNFAQGIVVAALWTSLDINSYRLSLSIEDQSH